MRKLRRSVHVRVTAAAIGLLVLAAALPVASVADPSLGQLNSALSASQSRASGLSATVNKLSGLISSLGSQIAFVAQREATVRAELAQERLALERVTAQLSAERRLLATLQSRLARARVLLARQLVSGYESDNPDLVSIVLESHGFTELIAVTRTAKAQADSAARRLAALEATDRQIAASTAGRVQALVGMNALLASRQGALQRARAAQAAALAIANQRTHALQSQIAQVEAQQAAAQQAASANPAVPYGGSASGSWVIPSSVVACESGGQNLTPNSAGASGYYQIIPSTWKQYGGSGPAAYLAPKSQQDAVAQRIWAGGAGASAWVCAQMLGIH
jgi:septal ring factor EnvC (AmiA/AmiB activator)